MKDITSKKLVVQIASASTGGIGRLTRDLCDTLPKERYEGYITYGRGQIFDSKRDYMFGSKAEVITHALLTRITDKAGLYSTKGTRQLIEFLREKNPDIIQLHNLHGYYLNYELLFQYLRESKKPVVWTLHDCWPFTGHCTHYTAEQCDQWKTHCEHCSQLRRYPKCCFKGNVYSNYERKKIAFNSVENLTIVTPSNWLKEQIQQSFLRYHGVRVIHNGIDLQLFRIKEMIDISKYNIPNKKIILGLASTWNDRKGFSDFIRLSKLLPEDYVVVLVGLSREQCQKLPTNIVGINHTENAEELVDLYNAAHIFLNLTYEDNFPTTNLEAMACGTSVLTYRSGGSPESITEETGYVVAPGNLTEVRKLILQHEKTPQSRQKCCEHAQDYEKYKMFSGYVELYEEILKQRG